MKYILIIWIYAWGNNVSGITTAEFNTKEACLNAGNKYMSENVFSKFICTEKGGRLYEL